MWPGAFFLFVVLDEAKLAVNLIEQQWTVHELVQAKIGCVPLRSRSKPSADASSGELPVACRAAQQTKDRRFRGLPLASDGGTVHSEWSTFDV